MGDPHVRRAFLGRTSNALYRRNLAKGQTGLSVAFDLPTQTGYDPDDELAARRGRQGRRAGEPHRRHAHAVRRHPARRGEHVDDDQRARDVAARAVRRRRRRAAAPRAATLAGTTQNDIVKEYLSRGTYVFPPAPSLRLIADMIAWSVAEIPKWNPINICSYHLQEAGATPAQELAYALSTAIAVLDAVRDAGQVPPERFPDVVARISFFVNAGLRFVEEMCKMRAFARAVGRDHARALRRRGPAQAQAALRGAGQLAGPHRGAAGEQRAADRAGDAGGHALARRAGPRDPAPGLERGARPAAAVGPAVGAAHAAGARLRDRPAGVRGPLRRLARGRGQGRRARREAARPRSTGCRRWAAPSRPSSPGT